MLKRFGPFLLSLLIIVADRLSKIHVHQSMTSLDSFTVIPGWLRIIHTENAGAAFGILSDGNRWLRSGILIGVSALVLAFVLSALWGKRTTFTGALGRIALGLVLGGAAGNLYDRVFIGTVTDFIEVHHGSWSFPAFNVADSAITVGAILLLLELMHPRHGAVREHADLMQGSGH
jgi:signal peptidase II